MRLEYRLHWKVPYPTQGELSSPQEAGRAGRQGMRCQWNNEGQHSSAFRFGTSSCDGKERVPDEHALEEEGWRWLKAGLSRDQGTKEMSLGSPWPGPSHSCNLLLVFQRSEAQPWTQSWPREAKMLAQAPRLANGRYQQPLQVLPKGILASGHHDNTPLHS